MLRNFWAQISADGGTPTATGSDDEGGIAIEVMRRALTGEMSTALRVIGKREADTLTLDVIVGEDVVYHERTTIQE